MASSEPEAARQRASSLDLGPKHPARPNPAYEEAVLRKARAADVRKPDEGHDAWAPSHMRTQR
jgi:hypothetical protein